MNEDLDNVREESILYELLEYFIRKQEPELIKCKNDSVILPTTGSIKNVLRYLNKRCILPEKLLQYVSLTLPWKFSVGDNGKILAILQENIIEIRKLKDEYSSVVSKASVPRDDFPQWRKLAWSPDGTILALSSSNGCISFYNSLGNNIYKINTNAASLDSYILETENAVASMIFKKPVKSEDKWDYEFICITYSGTLNSYYISTNDYKINHTFSFINFYKNGINSAVYCEKRNLFFISGNNISQSCNTPAYEAGLTVWRPLNEYPYYKLCISLEDESQNSSRFSLWNYIPLMNSKAQTVIFKMSLNPSSELLACLHVDGTISLWHVPGLQLSKQWKLTEQPDYNVKNPFSVHVRHPKYPQGLSEFHPLDIGWWLNQALVIARFSGVISICSIKNLHNLLGSSPEFLYGPLQMVECSAIRGVLCLDCEIYVMSTKRNSTEEDDTSSESDREAYESESGTIFNYATTILQSILYSMTDIEKFQPKRKKSKIFHRTYRIMGLKSTTPEELYARKIENEDYSEALELADKFQLDKDLAYKTQWRKSDFSESAIDYFLSKVTKKSWVLNECILRVPNNLQAAKELLLFGLKQCSLQMLICSSDKFNEDETDCIALKDVVTPYSDSEMCDDINVTLRQSQKVNRIMQKLDVSKLNNDQKEVVQFRRKLLKHMDMLKTYEILLENPVHYDKAFYQEFREKTPLENAVRFAKEGNCKGVIIMFTYFGNVLIPHWLPIISYFPETLKPENYEKLLPKCDECDQLYLLDQKELRQRDWSERPEFQKIVAAEYESEDITLVVYKNNPWFNVYKNVCLTQQVLRDWYTKRCYEIERLSGLVENALSLIKIGQAHNIVGLEKLLMELETLVDLVYTVGLENQTLDGLDKLSELEKVNLLMSRTNEANFIDNVNSILIPFVKKKQIYMNAEDVKKVVLDYFISLSKNSLIYISEFVQFAANGRNLELRSITEDYVQLALVCIYACDDDINIQFNASNIYETIIEDYENEELKTSVTRQDLETLRKELNCLEILNKYGVKVPLYFLRDNKDNMETIKSLLIKLCNSVKEEVPPASEKSWAQLLSDLLDIQGLVFHSFSMDTCLEIYLETRLKSGVKSIIQNSKSLMMTVKSHDSSSSLFKVPFERAVDLILDASHNYFNNATSLTDPNMDLARACLHLIDTGDTNVQREFDLISSLQLLHEFHLNILPLQVKLMKDKVKLIQDCLNSSNDSYKYHKKLLNLAKYLRIDNNARSREGKVLELVARKVFQAQDYNYCSKIIQRLIELSHQPAWQVALQLGRCEFFSDLTFRRQCLWFVVNIGPDDVLQETIKDINMLDAKLLDIDLQNWVEEKQASLDYDDEFVDTFSTPIAENKEFIPKIIKSSSKLVKDSTKLVTQSMIDIIKNQDVWTGSFKNLLKRNEDILYSNDQNVDLSNNENKQSFPCFYESLHKECKLSRFDTKYDAFSFTDNRNEELKLCQTLLRVQMLKESGSSGDESSDVNQLLIECAKNVLMEDCVLGIGYLLSVKDDHISDVKKALDNLPQTKMIIQLTLYYCALKLFKYFYPEANDILLHDPSDLISIVANLVEKSNVTNEVVLLFNNRIQSLEMLKKQENEVMINSKGVKNLESMSERNDSSNVVNDGWDDQWVDADWEIDNDVDVEKPDEIKAIVGDDEILLICEPKESVVESQTTEIHTMSEVERFKLFEDKYSRVVDRDSYNELKNLLHSWPLFFDEQYLTIDRNPILRMILKVKELFDQHSTRFEDQVLENLRNLLKEQIIPKEVLTEFLELRNNEFSTEEKLFLKLISDESFHSEVIQTIKESQENLKLPSVILEEIFFQNLTSHFSPNHHMYHKILEVVFMNRTIPEIQENIEILIKKLVEQKNIPHAVALLSQLESVPPCLSTFDNCFQRLLNRSSK